MSAAEAATQAVWLGFLLDDFGEEQTEATPFYCDNTSAVAMARNTVFHQRSKHTGRRYHYIRQGLQSNIINLVIANLRSN